MPEKKFYVGDSVYKVKGYKFEGTVVASLTKTNGEVRYVVEMKDNGMLHIFSGSQLEHIPHAVNIKGELKIQLPVDPLHERVLNKINSRFEKGYKEYGTTLHENNKLNFLLELQEELMDSINYIEKVLMDSEKLKKKSASEL